MSFQEDWFKSTPPLSNHVLISYLENLMTTHTLQNYLRVRYGKLALGTQVQQCLVGEYRLWSLRGKLPLSLGFLFADNSATLSALGFPIHEIQNCCTWEVICLKITQYTAWHIVWFTKEQLVFSWFAELLLLSSSFLVLSDNLAENSPAKSLPSAWHRNAEKLLWHFDHYFILLI